MFSKPSLILIESEAVRDFLVDSGSYKNLQILLKNYAPPALVEILSKLDDLTTFNQLDDLLEQYVIKENEGKTHRLHGLFFKDIGFGYHMYQLWMEYEAYKNRLIDNHDVAVLKQ